MARITAPRIDDVNYSGANALMANGQQLLANAGRGLQDTLNTYRNQVVDQHTAAALSLLGGATDANDLAARQQQVNQLVNAGDIDGQKVAALAAAMPDTIQSRQLNAGRLQQQATDAHDAPLLGQYMQAYMNGDTKGAQNILSQFQGDASKALTFAAGRQDQAADERYRNSQLGLQQARLNLDRQTAAQRAANPYGTGGANSILGKLFGSINAGNVNTDKSAMADAKARVTRAQQAVSQDPSVHPNLDPAKWASDNDHWYDSSSQYLYKSASGNPAFSSLSNSDQVALLKTMQSMFDQKPGGVTNEDWANQLVNNTALPYIKNQQKLRQAQDYQDQLATQQDAVNQLRRIALPYIMAGQ